MAHFVDTNIAIYAMLPGLKSERALQCLQRSVISVQVLNEFANVALRKLRLPQPVLALKISEIRGEVASVVPVTEEVHDFALEINSRYQLSFYDSALLAAALLADCDTLYSEDMQHGLVIERDLRIINPFA